MWRSKIPSFTLAAFTVIGGMVAAGPSYAVTLVGTTTDATGLNGLVVDGLTYDVTFVNNPYNTVYATTLPTFLGNEPGALDASTALAAALNSLSVTVLTGLTPSYFAEDLFVPYADNGLSIRHTSLNAIL